jgi:hypothetical protein
MALQISVRPKGFELSQSNSINGIIFRIAGTS